MGHSHDNGHSRDNGHSPYNGHSCDNGHNPDNVISNYLLKKSNNDFKLMFALIKLAMLSV